MAGRFDEGEWRPEGEDPNERFFHGDAWGIEGDASSFKDGIKRIGKALAGFVIQTLELAAEVPKFARVLIRAVVMLPIAGAQRLSGYRNAANLRERKARQELPSSQKRLARPTSDGSNEIADLMSQVADLQALGIPVAAERQPDGSWVIVIVAPDARDSALQEGRRLLEDARSGDKPGRDDSEADDSEADDSGSSEPPED